VNLFSVILDDINNFSEDEMKFTEYLYQYPSVRTFFRKLRLTFQFKYPSRIARISLFFRTIRVHSIEGYILNKIRVDRSDKICVFADKYATRHYVSKLVGEQYLTRLFGVYKNSEKLPWEIFPKEFVLKCSHSSGGIVIVSSQASANLDIVEFDYKNWEKYVIHPCNINHFRIETFFSRMLNQNYAQYTDYFEFAYSQIEPVVIVEELLKDENGDLPKDFKYWCFHGRVVLIQIDTDRYINHVRDFYDRDWNLLNVQASYPNSSETLERPIRLGEMIDLAEKLSNDSDLLRVDLYDLGDRIVVGELTNYPGGGVEKFAPRSFSKSLYLLLQSNKSRK